MKRFSPFSLFKGQWLVLSDYRSEHPVGDKIGRVIILLVPVVVFIWMWVAGATLRDVNSIVSGTAILAGTLLAAFGQLSSWRDRLKSEAERFELTDTQDRDSLDETVTHLLAAAYTSGLAAILLVVAGNTGYALNDGVETITGPFLWAGISVASHAALTFLVAVPRLYYAYVSVSRVRRELTREY